MPPPILLRIKPSFSPSSSSSSIEDDINNDDNNNNNNNNNNSSQCYFQALAQLDNSDDLAYSWKVCTKVKDVLEHGNRLENLSWRLWHLHSSLVASNKMPLTDFKKLSNVKARQLGNDHQTRNLINLGKNAIIMKRTASNNNSTTGSNDITTGNSNGDKNNPNKIKLENNDNTNKDSDDDVPELSPPSPLITETQNFHGNNKEKKKTTRDGKNDNRLSSSCTNMSTEDITNTSNHNSTKKSKKPSSLSQKRSSTKRSQHQLDSTILKSHKSTNNINSCSSVSSSYSSSLNFPSSLDLHQLLNPTNYDVSSLIFTAQDSHLPNQSNSTSSQINRTRIPMINTNFSASALSTSTNTPLSLIDSNSSVTSLFLNPVFGDTLVGTSTASTTSQNSFINNNTTTSCSIDTNLSSLSSSESGVSTTTPNSTLSAMINYKTNNNSVLPLSTLHSSLSSLTSTQSYINSNTRAFTLSAYQNLDPFLDPAVDFNPAAFCLSSLSSSSTLNNTDNSDNNNVSGTTINQHVSPTSFYVPTQILGAHVSNPHQVHSSSTVDNNATITTGPTPDSNFDHHIHHELIRNAILASAIQSPNLPTTISTSLLSSSNSKTKSEPELTNKTGIKATNITVPSKKSTVVPSSSVTMKNSNHNKKSSGIVSAAHHPLTKKNKNGVHTSDTQNSGHETSALTSLNISSRLNSNYIYPSSSFVKEQGSLAEIPLMSQPQPMINLSSSSPPSLQPPSGSDHMSLNAGTCDVTVPTAVMFATPRPAAYMHSNSTLSCQNCGVTQTPLWRRSAKKEELLCNACGLYEKTHQRDRPKNLKTVSCKRDLPPIPTACSNCKTVNTPLWRKDETQRNLCNACGLYRKLHGQDRPISMKSDVIRKRHRNEQSEVKKENGGQDKKERDDQLVDDEHIRQYLHDSPVPVSKQKKTTHSSKTGHVSSGLSSVNTKPSTMTITNDAEATNVTTVDVKIESNTSRPYLSPQNTPFNRLNHYAASNTKMTLSPLASSSSTTTMQTNTTGHTSSLSSLYDLTNSVIVEEFNDPYPFAYESPLY